MTRAKQTAYEAFTSNIEDAEVLLSYALAFENRRARRMRRELRDRFGDALKVPQNQRDQLDCLQSADVFLVFIPGGSLSRKDFRDLRPLLRQSLVAACAALETYVADKAMEFVGPALRADELPSGMKEVPLTVGHWVESRSYRRSGWRIRPLIEEHLRGTSSTAPNKIAEVLAVVGVKDWLKRVDTARNVERGTTDAQLSALTARRNRIAHTADRHGRGRASLTREEVGRYLETVNSVVDAIESLLENHKL